jgi:hypothetical protein
MTLVQKTINNTAYYTDGINYYTYHLAGSGSDPLWIFAAMDLGFNHNSLSEDQKAKVNDLAGTSINHKTKYLLLRNGKAEPMPYRGTVPAFNGGDIILRQVPIPTVGMVKCPNCASIVPPGSTCMLCGKPLAA